MPERVSELCADHLIIYDLRITRCELFRSELLPSVEDIGAEILCSEPDAVRFQSDGDFLDRSVFLLMIEVDT